MVQLLTSSVMYKIWLYATPLRVDSLTLLIQSGNRLHQSLARVHLFYRKDNIIITTDTDLCMFDSSRQKDR